jgi:hypothetical protein
VADREGRPIHVPREPAPGSAADIDESGSASVDSGSARGPS